ncbi:MAG: sugar-binding domain-containing protein [Actinomycetaceae bacterium]|nr:sugar-binding domain-containing protein [Actinomycetaceae bacterium]
MAQPTTPGTPSNHTGLLVKVAQYHYRDRLTKSEIGKRMGLSRFKIARLIDEAIELGIVEIRIHDSHTNIDKDLGTQLAAHLKLDTCLVVTAKSGDLKPMAQQLAPSAAAYMKKHTKPGDIVGFAWGRSVLAMVQELSEMPPFTAVQLTGSVGSNLSQSPIEVLHRLSRRGSQDLIAIFTPLFVASKEVRDLLKADPSLNEAFEYYSRLSTAVLSVGSWDPPVSQLIPFLTREETETLDRENTACETAGIFLNHAGEPVAPGLAARRISIAIAELMDTPKVVALAGGTAKAGALLALAKSGIITDLVTDSLTAAVLLENEAVDQTVFKRFDTKGNARLLKTFASR